MKKLFIAMLIAAGCVARITEARIVVECDNYDDSVNYKSYKTVGTVGVSQYAFIKSVKENTTGDYYLRLETHYRNHSSMASRYLTDKFCKIDVDGQIHQIPKVLDGSFPRPHETMTCSMPFAFYKFDTATIKAMKTAKEIKFIVNVPGKEEVVIRVNDSNKNEFKRMFELSFEDYKSDKNINEGL